MKIFEGKQLVSCSEWSVLA
uniref:Uncharacterized protein n=1 Tax=Arundo donax TaxID=35708 RepID=A0A0A9CNV6_ARUDO